jgi:Na+-transporting NADH:ubiquinone oxidoreductase subunit C
LKDSLYVIGFGGIFSTVCALLLTSAANFTAPYRENNARVEEVTNILAALNVPFEKDDSAEQLLEIFERDVREEKRGDMTFFIYASPEEPNKPKALAVRFAGPGLWGPIEGFLAVEPDMRTIRAVTFSHQEETPGLGGEIASSWFRDQFVGKSLMDATGRIGVAIGGAPPGPTSVNAITGATMTCDKLEAILKDVMTRFIEETHEPL